MITTQGRELISKYLLGQAPSYASYISFGCGDQAVDSNGNPVVIDEDGNETTQWDKQSMNFEMLRVPISSRSNLLSESGVNLISFAGDIPLEEQYVITEVAVWSDARNAATQSDSRVLFAFTSDENWQVKNGTEISVIPIIEESLSGKEADPHGSINVNDSIFITDADNLALVSGGRDGQGTRFLNRTIMFRGDGQGKLFLDGRNIDLSSNSGRDLLKFAFAMYPKEPTWSTPPPINFTIRFQNDPNLEVTNDDDPPAGTAVWKGSVQPDKYTVVQTELQDIVTSSKGFSWKGTRYIEISFESFDPNWYLGIDAIRFDNITSPNPLYVMSGYTTVGNAPALVKGANTNAYAEFRFGLNVNG